MQIIVTKKQKQSSKIHPGHPSMILNLPSVKMIPWTLFQVSRLNWILTTICCNNGKGICPVIFRCVIFQKDKILDVEEDMDT